MKRWVALLLMIVFVASSPAAYAAAMLSDTGADSKTASAASSSDADKAQSYAEAERLLAQGDIAHAAMTFGKITGYKDAWERSSALWREIIPERTIDTSGIHIVGVRTDGTVIATGNNTNYQCDISDWRDIISVATGRLHTVGLRSDGTVVAAGYNNNGELDVGKWTDIVAIAAGLGYTLGLQSDGTVVATGLHDFGQCDVSGWRDIVGISAGCYHSVGLKADGTVVASGSNKSGQCNLSEWTDIISISVGSGNTFGVKANGTVLAAGRNYEGECKVSSWTDITSVVECYGVTLGLKNDGMILSTQFVESGFMRRRECDATNWHGIIALSSPKNLNNGGTYIVGLKADGTAIAAGDSIYELCDVSNWHDLKVPSQKTLYSSTSVNLDPSNPDGSFNYTILQNEPGYLYDKFDDYWTWYAAYDEPYLDADLIIGIQLEGEMGGTDLAGVTLYTKIMDKNGRAIDGVSSMVFLIDGMKYSYNEMAEEGGAMAGAVVLYDSGYELIKAFASAQEVSVKLNLFSGNTVRLDLNETEFNNTLKYISRKIIDYRLWDYYIENPALGIIELMFPLEITKK